MGKDSTSQFIRRSVWNPEISDRSNIQNLWLSRYELCIGLIPLRLMLGVAFHFRIQGFENFKWSEILYSSISEIILGQRGFFSIRVAEWSYYGCSLECFYFHGILTRNEVSSSRAEWSNFLCMNRANMLRFVPSQGHVISVKIEFW